MLDLLPPEARRLYARAQADHVAFWEEAALNARQDLFWFRKWDQVLEWEYPSFKWFTGGQTNVSYNCLDYKIERGLGDKAAFVAERGDTGERTVMTYAELLEQVKTYAAALRGIGVETGDRVAIYMPMSIEAAAAMLACARIGAIHMVVFAGFSPGAIADRVELTGARFVLTEARGSRRNKPVPLKEMVDEALDRIPDESQVKAVAVLDRSGSGSLPMKSGRDIGWQDFLARAHAFSPECVHMEANQTLFLLPTSGTTAKPKVTVQNHGGYQVYCYSMGKWVYGLKEDDMWFSTSDIGWIVGHSYNVYGPLLTGCTSILYEGTPDFPRQDMWWDIIERNRVTGMFTSPTGVRALMRYGVDEARKHDVSTLQRIVCAGEVLNPEAWQWLHNEVLGGRVPIIDHMWQTETTAAIVGYTYGVGMPPVKPGSAGFPVPGVEADVVSETDGRSLPPGQKGVLVIKKPFPGLTPTLWEDPARYKKDYWEARPGTEGMYYAGDAASRDEEGYIWFAGRADEVIKIAAHRLGTIEIENALVAHPAVIEAAAAGVPDELRGEVASALVVLDKAYQPSDELREQLIQHVRKEMGPIVVIKDLLFVRMLPKTRSGKIMRRVIKSLLTNKELGDLSTIEEEASVDEIRQAVENLGHTPGN